MPSETVWNNHSFDDPVPGPSASPSRVWESNSKPASTIDPFDRASPNLTSLGQPMTQFRSVLDQVDSDVLSIVSGFSQQNNSSPIQNFSGLGARRRSNDGSDIDSDVFGNGPFGLKRTTLSAISAPLGTYNNVANSRLQSNVFGAASISGGIANKHLASNTSTFMEKFASVAEATKEIELSSGIGRLSIGTAGTGRKSEVGSRRTSFLAETNSPFFNQETAQNNGILSSPGSLNENLNTSSRHQSISEKIDYYNSPNHTSATLALATENKGNDNNNVHHNIWNPAGATTFTPSSNYYGEPNQSNFPNMFPPQQMYPFGVPYGQYPMPPVNNAVSPPPFMMSAPAPQMMDPQVVALMTQQGISSDFQQLPSQNQATDTPIKTNEVQGENSDKDENNETIEETSNKTEEELKNERLQTNTPGIGLMNRQLRFMFPPFNPYSVYQPGPPPMGFDSSMLMMPQPSSPPQSSQSNDVHSNGNGSGVSGNGNSNGNINNDGSSNSNKKSGKNRSLSPTSGNYRGSNSKNNGNGNANHIYRSPLLEEIRNNKSSKEYSLKDIYGHAIEFSKDQHGSRFIQQKLEKSSFEEKEVIFNEVRDIALDLMTDVFGNYVIQKYFEYGTDVQKAILLQQMQGQIHNLSLQMYGCRVIQRAIEYIALEQQISIINELRDFILPCVKDQNGNHVIQKSIEKIPFQKIEFILESLKSQIYHLSTHPYGCRVIQRLLEFSNLKDQEFILNELNRYIFYLIQDQYGNYVMQHIIEHGSNKDRQEILKIVLGSVVTFSKHKFASNVVEKCIIFGNNNQRELFLNEVLSGNENAKITTVDDQSPLALMMKDQFANYVVQKLVDVIKGDRKKLLIMKIKQYLKQISKSSYGKHLASIEKLIVLSETALSDVE